VIRLRPIDQLPKISIGLSRLDRRRRRAVARTPAIGSITAVERGDLQKGKGEMRNTLSWIVLVVAGVALLIAAVGAILALLTGHARFIEVAWVSIAGSLFVLAWATLDRPLS
jgi:hypothetical protein